MFILLQLRWFFAMKWPRYLVALIALASVSGLIMVPPWITGNIVDAIAEQRLTTDELLRQCGLIVVVAFVIYILRNVWRIALYGASFQLASLLRQRIYDHLCLMTPRFYQKHHTGDLMARATNDVNAVETTAGEGVLALFDGVLTGIVVLTVMVLTLSWKLTLLAMLPWPLMGYLMWRFTTELHHAFADAQQQFSRLNDLTQESLTGIRLIKAFGQQRHTAATYAAVAQRTTDANHRVAAIDAKYDPTIFIAVGASFLLTVGGGAWWIKQGELTVGELTTFTIYLGYLIWPMFAFGWVLNILERGAAAYQRIDQLLQTETDIPDHGNTATVADHRLTFAIRRYAHDDRGDTLRAIHIDMPPASTLGIVGPTGAGKTTLLELLLRLRESDEAVISLSGHPLPAYRLDALRQEFGLVPQDPFLFSATIAENIALGHPESDLDAIRGAARLACIDDDILAFPDRYDTLVGERGITLSGGQKQRLAIARALLRDPPVMVLDDALSAVDVDTERRILTHLRQDRSGRSNIIVSHRLSAVMDADRIIVLQQGGIAERGDHTALMNNNGWYAQMFRYQQIAQTLER